MIFLVTMGRRGGYDLFALVALALGYRVYRVLDVELLEFNIVGYCPFLASGYCMACFSVIGGAE